ncbi:MAG: TIGR01906 family membrane protein [Chloroflexi bacterium HGW-Chloroflexi-10]|nr:MAG: TIGR01906 family membrane protein [Chloroflexi bacterium HGW-Chloroflexi-10]
MNRFQNLTSWLITISLPYVLIMLSIRLLFNPLFLMFEYNFPNFPPDNYGFSTQERLKWGSLSIEYMFNEGDPDFLANLAFENGQPIYNEREVSHMLDVKILVQATLRIFYGLVILYLAIILWAILRKWTQQLWAGLSRGGWLTLILIGAVLAGVAISFDALFTAFHKVFFTGDTWLFYYSDTLIRLFPIRLWQDAFILMGVFTVGMSLFFAIYGKKQSLKT